MSKEVKKELNGKEFVASLEGCRSSQDIFELLDKTMDKDTLKNRLQNVRDNALNAQASNFNAWQGLLTSHQDCVNMAADKYQQINKNKGVKFFKAEMNKFITAKEKEHYAKELSAPLLAARKSFVSSY